jgi:hypothetical protein
MKTSEGVRVRMGFWVRVRVQVRVRVRAQGWGGGSKDSKPEVATRLTKISATVLLLSF